MALQEKRPWLWVPPKDSKYIGKRGLPRKDAREKASGKAIYCRDMFLPGMVYAKPLNSPYAHARIKSIDVSRAKEIPGVIDVVKWDDPELKDKWPAWCPNDDVEPIYMPYLMDKAYFYGQPVGVIVVAETEEACDRALELIKRSIEWEELPFNLDWDKFEEYPPAWPDYEKYSPLAKGNLEFPTIEYEFGSVEEGFRQADRVISFTIRKSEEDVWAGVEGSVAISRWVGNYLEIWTNHQNIPPIRRRLAKELNIPESHIEIFSSYRGAHFGGRTFLMSGAIEITSALLSRKFGKPVKFLDDYSDFRGAEHHLGTYRFKVGFKNDGTITAVDVETVYACRGFGKMLLDPISKILESTSIPNVRLRSIYPFVNRNPTICYKHGAPACTVVTMVINRVASELNMDPTEVALKNDGWEGHDIRWVYENIAKKHGFQTERWSLKECIEIGKKLIDWDEKWHPPGTKILPNGKYHGIGFTAMYQWSHRPVLRVQFTPQFIAFGIRVEPDGTVSIFGQRGEGGVAGDTSYSQVVADEIGVSFEKVVLRPFIYKGFHAYQMGGSAGMVSNLYPLVKAARKVRSTILELATLLPDFGGKRIEDLDIKDGLIYEKNNPEKKVPLENVAAVYPIMAWADSSDWSVGMRDEESDYRIRLPALVRQCYFVEVEVDSETGKVDIVKVICVNDVGRAINPDAVNGQQYGGAYMGLGRAFMEAIYYDPLTGVKLNDNLAEYPVLLMNDVKEINCHIVETGLGYGPYGSAGCSEAPGAVLSTIAAPAIYNAIGKWIDDWPITPEKILKALGKT